MRGGILSNRSQGVILGNMSIRFRDMRGTPYLNRNYKLPNPPYVEKMLCLNKVICFKCRNPIELGERYTYYSSKCLSKYYHDSCYETMFY